MEVDEPSRVDRQRAIRFFHPEKYRSSREHFLTRANLLNARWQIRWNQYNIKSLLNFKFKSLSKVKICLVEELAKFTTPRAILQSGWERGGAYSGLEIPETWQKQRMQRERVIIDSLPRPAVLPTGFSHSSFCERREKRVRFETEAACIFLAPLFNAKCSFVTYPASRSKYFKKKLHYHSSKYLSNINEMKSFVYLRFE